MLPYFGHIQTVLGAKLPFRPFLPQHQVVLDLPDGDQLVLHHNTPKNTKENAPLVVLFHGLCGSHQANYVTRVARKLYATGFHIIRVDFRGCSAGNGRAKGMAHCGRSEDALTVFQWCHHTYQKPILPVGFSMGGNILLQCLGKLGQQAHDLNIQQAIALSPPVDLAACADMMEHQHNAIFRYYFMVQLNQAVADRHQHYPELGPAPRFGLQTGFWEFDDRYTAPQSGFRSAQDYYQQSSAKSVLQDVAIPCHILTAQDDPFISHTPWQQRLPRNLHVTLTKTGGHLGFLGNPLLGPLRKMDRFITQHILE